MLRFRLGDIPVEVRFSHLLFSALLGTLMVRDMPVLEPGAWPYAQLHGTSPPGHAATALWVALGWMGLISSAVFVHELGHALVLRAFGHSPSIRLLWLGGQTRPRSAAPLPWYQYALFTAGGPLAGFVLALTTFGLWHFHLDGGSEAVRFLLGWSFITNLFWTLFNLIPVPTLDGGTLVTTLATRLLGKGGFLGAQVLALTLCVALVAFGLQRAPVLGLLFGLYGLQALRLLLAAARGRIQVLGDEPPAPLARELRRAREALEGGRVDEARQLGERVLEAKETGLELASRAHHLLGWVALKEGQGRAALDHFAQARRQPVETHALAAAFSLLGDEPRALTLWELAWNQTRHPTVLHEYAGALIRAARVNNALGLPGVRPEAAFLCAGRTLFTRGAYSEAAAIAEAGLAHAPAAQLAYDAACAHARARHLPDAVRMLRRATELGFADAPYAASDEDLALLHGHPDFEHWLETLRKSPAA
jgi:Zn-dependent protease